MDSPSTQRLLLPDTKPFVSILKVTGLSLAGLFIFQFIALFIVGFFTEGGLTGVINNLNMSPPDPSFRNPLLFIQGLSAGGGFILGPWLYLHYIERKKITAITNSSSTSGRAILFMIASVFFFMLCNERFIYWNEHIQLPAFLEKFELWAQAKELEIKKLTLFLTTFDSFGQFLVGFVVIAILPAIGEEFLFRGLIQNKLIIITKNAHIAIWITGFLFSIIHFQFYGLIPRALLGVLFGYLYYWSGNLILPILAHFINNGISVTFMYMMQRHIIPPASEQAQPGWIEFFIGIILFTVSLYLFRMTQREDYSTTHN